MDAAGDTEMLYLPQPKQGQQYAGLQGCHDLERGIVYTGKILSKHTVCLACSSDERL